MQLNQRYIKLKSYIATTFLKRFIESIFFFFVLIFFINFIEHNSQAKNSDIAVSKIIAIAFYATPAMLDDIAPSIVMLAAIITFFLLSSRSEITIMRSSGLSLWQIIQPAIVTAFLLGILWVTTLNPIAIAMAKTSEAIQTKYLDKEDEEYIAPRNGIWLKQPSLNDSQEEIIIRSQKTYRRSLEMRNVSAWFVNASGEFYKRIDAKSMFFYDGFWLMQDVLISDSQNINSIRKAYTIPTSLNSDFIGQTVLNSFNNPSNFSIFELPDLIKNLKLAGFPTNKFEIHLHKLFNKPLLFVAMTIIACYFAINHIRKNNAAIMIFCGIALGLILYITSQLLSALGSSGVIPVFVTTWTISFVYLAIAVLLIYRKETA